MHVHHDSTLFSEYLRLHWPDHPDLNAITTNPHLYAIQIFRSMQGQKDTDRLLYHLLKGAFDNIGRHCSIAYHAVFVWKEIKSEIFVTIATDDFLCLVDDRAQFIHLETPMEALFDMTLQEYRDIPQSSHHSKSPRHYHLSD
jgi:hypothetical protein